MKVTATLRYLRIAPRKVRLLADLIRGKRADDAQNILNFSLQKSAGILLKLLKQAIANAKNNSNMEESNLYISKITVDSGPMLKRFRPRARGSANEIQKKTSHITIVLEEIEKSASGSVASSSFGKAKKHEKDSGSERESIKEGEDLKNKKQDQKIKIEKEILKPKTEGVKTKIFRRQTF